MKNFIRNCSICGNAFQCKAQNHIYCSPKCRRKAGNISKNKSQKYLNSYFEKKNPKKDNNLRKKPKLSIDQIVKKATEEGLTYGKYMEKHNMY